MKDLEFFARYLPDASTVIEASTKTELPSASSDLLKHAQELSASVKTIPDAYEALKELAPH